MKNEIFSKTGNRFKANLHCHTVFSDGCKTPEEIKKIYTDAGYSIVAFSDHNVLIDHSELNDDRFLAMLAIEVDVYLSYGRDDLPCYHINFYPKKSGQTAIPCYNPIHIRHGAFIEESRRDQKHIGGEDYVRRYEAAQEIVDAYREEGFLAMLNHPTWSLQSAADFARIRGAFAMELYNHGCYIGGYDEINTKIWDRLLAGGTPIFGTATDDNHNKFAPDSRRWDSCGGFTVIQADELTQESVTEALKKGKFYASTGPLFHSIVLEDDRLYVETSPVDHISLSTGRRKARIAYPEAGEATLTSAVFDLSALPHSYVRLTIVDEHGKQAWSQPIWEYTGKQD